MFVPRTVRQLWSGPKHPKPRPDFHVEAVAAGSGDDRRVTPAPDDGGLWITRSQPLTTA